MPFAEPFVAHFPQFGIGVLVYGILGHLVPVSAGLRVLLEPAPALDHVFGEAEARVLRSKHRGARHLHKSARWVLADALAGDVRNADRLRAGR